ncbi:MAG: response regulator [bacterium]|nr:response regulator [bacterium]
MNFNLGLTFSGLIYTILVLIIYTKRKKIKTFETIVYKNLLVITIVELLSGCISVFTVNNIENMSKVNDIINVLYLISLAGWIMVFTMYIVSIPVEQKSKFKIKKIFTIMYIFVSITIYLLPINYVYNETIIYSEGLAVRFTYLIAILSIILIIISSIKNYKNLLSKKYVPMFVFLTFGTLALMLQILNPELFLVSPLEVLVTITMYFTIENPDVKLLKEMHDAKVISDNANEEKTMFLYNMTQEIRETTKNINVEADNILESKDLELDKDSARNIKGETSKFTTMTNDILDVSTIDSSNIKIYNTKYNIKTILKEVVSNYKTISMNKGIEFRSNIEHNIPDMLYGDSIGLKKVLTLLLKESIKNTNKGYIEFNVNTIIKKDIIRLIITIEDSGIGIKANELESVKINNKNISESYKTITLMNGTMILSSNYGMGTKISIILDQKIEEKVTKELTMYKNTYDNKSILVVDDNESTHKLIEKLLKDSNINIDYSLNGKDTLNKIKSKNKYDLILIDEELSQITGAELLIKLKEIRNFNTPVILLTKDNKYEYSEEYLKQGFTNVIIKPLKKDNLLQVIDKFTK